MESKDFDKIAEDYFYLKRKIERKERELEELQRKFKKLKQEEPWVSSLEGIVAGQKKKKSRREEEAKEPIQASQSSSMKD
jgi:hypothetical protein